MKALSVARLHRTLLQGKAACNNPLITGRQKSYV